MSADLSAIEIGYDRDYIGMALHCRICPPSDRFPGQWPASPAKIGMINDGDTLADAVAIALAHLATHT